MAEQNHYGSGLFRAPYGYEFAPGPRKHVVKKKSHARIQRIREQLLQRLDGYRLRVKNGQSTDGCFLAPEDLGLAEAVEKGAIPR